MDAATALLKTFLQETLGGHNPLQNTNVRYSGSTDDVALNRDVPRYPAENQTATVLASANDPTGRPRAPVLTLHAIDDPRAFVENQSAYRAAVTKAGALGNLFQAFTNQGGHCRVHHGRATRGAPGGARLDRTKTPPTNEALAAACESIASSSAPAVASMRAISRRRWKSDLSAAAVTRDHDRVIRNPTPSPEALVRSLRGFMLALVSTACSADETTSPSPTPRANGSSPSVAVTSAACGDVVTSDLRLENDLVWPVMVSPSPRPAYGSTCIATPSRDWHGRRHQSQRQSGRLDLGGIVAASSRGCSSRRPRESSSRTTSSRRTRPRCSFRRRAATRSRRTSAAKFGSGIHVPPESHRRGVHRR